MMRRIAAFVGLFLIGLILVLGLGTAAPAVGAISEADQLNQQGFERLDRGQTKEALSLWKLAELSYRKLQDEEGITGSQVNQSLALQNLGLYTQACDLLIQALHLEQVLSLKDNSPPDPEQVAPRVAAIAATPARLSGMNRLGEVLRSMGHTDLAQLVLAKALIAAPKISPELVPALTLGLANVERDQVLRLRTRYSLTDDAALAAQLLTELQASITTALRLYEQVKQGGETLDSVLAQVNLLSFLVNLQPWLRQQTGVAVTQVRPQIDAAIAQQLSQMQALNLDKLTQIQSIYARLNLAVSLAQLQQPQAKLLAQQALTTAIELNDNRAQSYAIGTLGELEQQDDPAVYQRALSLARSVQARDVAYRWERALGAIYQQQGKTDQAVKLYQAALQDLDWVRFNLRSIDADVQFSFQDQVEPIYQEFIAVLFSANQPDLQSAIAVQQQFQIAELENYLRCGNFSQSPLLEVAAKGTGTTQRATGFYFLDGGEQFHIVVQSVNGALHHYTADKKKVLEQMQRLWRNLSDPAFVLTGPTEFLPPVQSLYQQLISPAQAYLPANGTLIFTSGTSLQVPWEMLHDGKQYLVERYSVANTLGALVRPPVPLKRRAALVAGVSQVAPSFAAATPRSSGTQLQPLPEVEQEVQDVSRGATTTVLLNQDFTLNRLQSQIRSGSHEIVHLITHGQFSSDLKSTFLLAWDQPLSVPQFEQLVRANLAEQSIELLVLSACQTAKGDRRSTLGLAGIAAQAGARSTLASLWLVDSPSTAQLMGKFYARLAQGDTKAEALRAAKLSLLSESKTKHPYYWAPFILVGSWV